LVVRQARRAAEKAIAYQSFRRLPGADVEGRVFADRLSARAHAYSIVTTANSTPSDVETILRSVVAPFDPRGDRFKLSGKQEPLDAKATLGLTLVGHELCTNAVKYGSLSVPEGQVTIRWDRNCDSRICIEWIESGGPVPQRPIQAGFGSKLIDGAFGSEYKASVRRRYEHSGLLVTIEFLGSAEPTEEKAVAA
jgi:two-component sensor histidine kinase